MAIWIWFICLIAVTTGLGCAYLYVARNEDKKNPKSESA